MGEKSPPDVGEKSRLSQSRIFLEGEANSWFERNRVDHSLDGKVSSEVIEITRVLHPHRDSIRSILEIGCSDGRKLEQLCGFFDATGAGIDPSDTAVRSGNERLQGSSLSLSVGLADRLPYSDSSFDLVHFGFCLYLVDRDTLCHSLQEAHRVLRPGGFLAITDFDPAVPHSRPYHHYAGVFSYKRDYAAVLAHPGFYHLMHKYSFSHRQPYFDSDPDERIAVSVLYKELTNTGETPITL
ncbi:MAG: hypothetical protein RL518_2367 [Pseudomonadota bacterium]|jgi:ubiquinone/menaquinone biosynthesis C-methylase UbiE